LFIPTPRALPNLSSPQTSQASETLVVPTNPTPVVNVDILTASGPENRVNLTEPNVQILEDDFARGTVIASHTKMVFLSLGISLFSKSFLLTSLLC
jgi:hypothetical protein